MGGIDGSKSSGVGLSQSKQIFTRYCISHFAGQIRMRVAGGDWCSRWAW